ncbi:MAG: phage portal protein [Terrimicrobiaceae bacterium]
MASEIKEQIKKSNRGGRREGAGRKPKAAAFEAAEQSINRGIILLNTVEPRKELTEASRTAILKKARWLYNNVGVAAYIIEHLAQRAVGTGIVPQARSSDAKWNREVERAFEDRACGEAWAFDAAGAVNFYGAQSLILRQVACDGDFFAQFLTTAEGAARVRFIGAESVGNTKEKSEKFFDGVRLDGFGAPIEYRVITDRTTMASIDVPALDMLHFRHIRRAGYARGLSWLHNAAINLQDLSEILAYTKGSFKSAAQLAFAITSTEQFKLGTGLSGAQSAVTDGVNRETLYNGTMIPNLRPGEKIEMLKNEHPGTSFEPFVRHIVGEVARGIGLPPEALMIFVGTAGTEFRGLLEVAQNFLERLQQMLIDQFCRRFWKYWVWHEITAGRISYPGDDWWRHDWVTPKKITVDNGRDGRLYADLLDKGHMSWERYSNIHGLDAEAEEDDIIKAYIRRQKKCADLGLDASQVFPSQKSAVV